MDVRCLKSSSRIDGMLNSLIWSELVLTPLIQSDDAGILLTPCWSSRWPLRCYGGRLRHQNATGLQAFRQASTALHSLASTTNLCTWPCSLPSLTSVTSS